MMRILKLIVDQLAAKGEQKKEKDYLCMCMYTQSAPYKARIRPISKRHPSLDE